MKPADVIGGKYRLVSVLGQGGMGSVWRAQHLGLNAPVAIKLMDPALAANAEGLARFHREAQAAAALRSPHVVQVLDHGIDEATSQPFIVMEMMEGESLAGRIERHGRLAPGDTARIVTQVARALARAHGAGIVHRDLKPDNVFLVQNEDEEQAKVLDFGIAKSEAHRLTQGTATQTGAVMGTPYYMSPEQISGSKSVDFRTDLWALGVIACECLTGRRPFEAETIGGLALRICVEPAPQPSMFGPVPASFDAWFARATARDANQRFQSARELADALRAVCSGAPSSEIDTVFAAAPTIASPSRVPTPHFGHTETALSRSAGPDNPFRSRSKMLPIVVGVLGIAAAASVAALLLRSSAPEAATPALQSAAVQPPAPAKPAREPVATAAAPVPAPAPQVEVTPAPEPAEPSRESEVAPALRASPTPRPRRPSASNPRSNTAIKSAAPAAASKPDAAPASPTDVLDERR